MSVLKKAEDTGDLILRFFNPTESSRKDILSIPFLSIRRKLDLAGFEIKTLRINPRTKNIAETNLLER